MTAAKTQVRRLRPGELDGLVLAYMRKRKDGPLIASAIGKGLGRSSGVVANCLARLAKERESDKPKAPRAYVLREEAKGDEGVERSTGGVKGPKGRSDGSCPFAARTCRFR